MRLATTALALTLAGAAALGAQAPAPGRPGTPAPQAPGAPGAPPQQNNRPRAVQVMTLTGPWPDGGAIPAPFSQAGRDQSPALSWSNVPDGVTSFALDRPRPRRRHRQRHRRPAALDGVEHSRHRDGPARRGAAGARRVRTAAVRSAPAGRTIADRPPRRAVPRITTSSSCMRSTPPVNVRRRRRIARGDARGGDGGDGRTHPRQGGLHGALQARTVGEALVRLPGTRQSVHCRTSAVARNCTRLPWHSICLSVRHRDVSLGWR